MKIEAKKNYTLKPRVVLPDSYVKGKSQKLHIIISIEQFCPPKYSTFHYSALFMSVVRSVHYQIITIARTHETAKIKINS